MIGSGIQQGTPEEVTASNLSNRELAWRIDTINRRGMYSKAEKKAFLREAAIRLRWANNYTSHIEQENK